MNIYQRLMKSLALILLGMTFLVVRYVHEVTQLDLSREVQSLVILSGSFVLGLAAGLLFFLWLDLLISRH